MPRQARILAFVLLALLFSVSVLTADWPGWLGPRRDGTSTEKIAAWKGTPKVLWRVAVGPGHSSPIVADGKVFLHTRVKDKDTEAEEVTAYDSKTGKLLWARDYPRSKFSSPFGTGPQATPSVVDGKVYSFGATGVLTCIDAKAGSIDWKVETQKEFKAKNLFFGAASSPLVHAGKVYVNVGGKGASVVAFDAKNGEVVWKALDDPASYSSGVVLGSGSDEQVVFLTQQGLRGFTAKDGKKLWDFPLVDKLNESSTTPIQAGDLLLASSITYGMVGLKLEKSDEGLKAKQLWKNPKLTCYFSTPIPVGKKHVYLVAGSLSFRPVSHLHCIETETGKILWTKEKVGKYHAALLRTADNRMLMLSDLGELVLFDADPKEYKELARSQITKGEQIWAHPALVGGMVYFRDEKELICLQME
jgi:outer membrane protein assembly factor BamB